MGRASLGRPPRGKPGAPRPAPGARGHARWAPLAAAACALVTVAAACAGSADIPESRYYRIASGPPAAVAQAPLPVTLGVATLGGPETYRQERLVYRTATYRVDFYPYDRWEVPPVEMVTDALINHLRGAGLFQRVVPYARDGRVDYVVRGRLLRFDEEDGGPGTPWTAVVELDYQVLDPQKGDVVANGVARASLAVEGRQPSAIVAALSLATRDALGELAAQVAGAMAARAGRR